VNERLRRHLKRLKGKRVLVYGDLVCDEYVHTSIDRPSREAPVLILRYRDREVRAGGAANSVRNLVALGGKARPVGVVGEDEAGKELMALLRRERVPLGGVLASKGYPTPRKTRVMAGGVHTVRQQVVRIDHVEVLGGGAKTDVHLRKALHGGLRQADAILISDYGIGTVRPLLAWELLEGAKKREIPVVVDSRHRLAELAGATLTTPSEEEGVRILGAPLPRTTRALERAGRKLLEKLGSEAVLLTRGSKGMVLFRRGKPLEGIPIFGTDEVADVTGAGDTVASTLALALAGGVPVLDAARLANAAAGISVLRLGAATVSHGELDRSLKQGRPVLGKQS
jgi:rfaE bifunctional protein kinase chain/domain